MEAHVGSQMEIEEPDQSMAKRTPWSLAARTCHVLPPQDVPPHHFWRASFSLPLLASGSWGLPCGLENLVLYLSTSWHLCKPGLLFDGVEERASRREFKSHGKGQGWLNID